MSDGNGTFSVFGGHLYRDDGHSPGNGTPWDDYAIDVAIAQHETANVTMPSSSSHDRRCPAEFRGGSRRNAR